MRHLTHETFPTWNPLNASESQRKLDHRNHGQSHQPRWPNLRSKLNAWLDGMNTFFSGRNKVLLPDHHRHSSLLRRPFSHCFHDCCYLLEKYSWKNIGRLKMIRLAKVVFYTCSELWSPQNQDSWDREFLWKRSCQLPHSVIRMNLQLRGAWIVEIHLRSRPNSSSRHAHRRLGSVLAMPTSVV